MAEELHITGADKESIYKELLPQLKALLQNESDRIANMANFCGAYKEVFRVLWVGFYIVKESQTDPSTNELVLGPFQGPIACTRIQKGKGVCGAAWEIKKTICVGDVNSFPGHISCSALSKSEIVIPLFNNKKEIYAVLDIDSEQVNYFDAIDEKYLNEFFSSVQL